MTDFTNRILVLFAHPALHRSRVHRHLLAAAKGVAGITLHDLYETYPDFQIDIKREQALLGEHDIIVLQHPFYWYSAPALVKEWIDLVLEYNWAFGAKGTALRGKLVISAITTGGQAASYGPGRLNRYTLREFLRPIEQTMVLCRMKYLPPFVVQGTHTLDPAQIQGYAGDYRRLLERLRDGTLGPAVSGSLQAINPLLEHDA